MAKILIAEDDEVIVNLYKLWFESKGHEVRIAENGTLGFRNAIFENQPDLVLTDIMMPRADGEELAGMIEMIFPGTPIIVITGMTDVGRLARIQGEGNVRKVLRKPVTYKEVMSAVDEALASARPDAQS